MSADSSEEVPWWEESLAKWQDEGFDTSRMRNSLNAKSDMASVKIEDFQNLVEQAIELNRRLSSHRILDSERFESWRKRLVDPLSLNTVLSELDSWSRTHRPWELVAWRRRDLWSDSGLDEQLSAIVNRLDALDRSSIPQAEEILPLFESPTNYEELLREIITLEGAESRRKETIARAVEALSEEGIEVGDLAKYGILEQLKKVDEMHSLVRRQRRLRSLIEIEILPVDQELAERLDEKRLGLLSLEHVNGLHELENEVASISENLQNRLDLVNDKVNSWRKEGIILPHSDLVRPEELIEWEVNLGQIENTVNLNREARKRLEKIALLWPSEEVPPQSETMRLDRTEDLIDIVESLEQQWRETELGALNIIEECEDDGFQMDHWRHRVAEEPRTALKWLENEAGLYNRARSVIDDLERIDVTIESGEEISERISVLREIELNDVLLEEMEFFLDIRAKRGARHRLMLEREWMELCEHGRADNSEPTSSWSLARFEEEVAAARMGTRVESSIERLSRRMRQEIVEWNKDGWNVSVLLEMLDSDSVGVGRMMPIMRKEMSRHNQLLERMDNLPWENDVDLAAQVRLDLSHPEKLNVLWNDVPKFAKILAESGPPDTGFKWDPWKPGTPERQVLVPIPETMDIPTLIPDHVPADPHEEMLEATLEEMEKEEIVEPPLVEEIPVLEEEHEESKDSDEIEEVISPITEVEAMVDVELSMEPLESLLGILGMKQDALGLERGELMSNIRRHLAGNVGVEPRDTRVDRLLRLTIRCLPQQNSLDIERMKLIGLLENCAHRLSKWTRNRLVARHSTPRGGLLLDSELLGAALERIPGPGHHLPLTADEYPLPEIDDLEGLSQEVAKLANYSAIPTSGGIKAA